MIYSKDMKNRKINVVTEEAQRHNPETGILETFTSRKVFTQKITSEDFCFIYSKFIQQLYGIEPKESIMLWIWLMSHLDYNTCTVTMSRAKKQRCLNELNITDQTFRNWKKALLNFTIQNEYGVQEHILTEDMGDFNLNPALVWKGLSDIRRDNEQDIRITFEVLSVSEKD